MYMTKSTVLRKSENHYNLKNFVLCLLLSKLGNFSHTDAGTAISKKKTKLIFKVQLFFQYMLQKMK